jgi:multisubunit Na+/H+ antiporter MnhB subunit
MDYVLLLGTIGLIILLIAFIIEHTKIKKKKFYFNLLNFIGSTILGIYAILTSNIIFIILEFAWAIFSIVYLIKDK